MPRETDRVELMKGTLDLLILKSLRRGPMHGHGIAKHIERSSEDVLQVEHGSLYPALHRLVRKGWISSEWETLAPSERELKYYRLTATGRQQLATEESKWSVLARAIGKVLKAT
jgi:PadR family transcriptional regulator PadR